MPSSASLGIRPLCVILTHEPDSPDSPGLEGHCSGPQVCPCPRAHSPAMLACPGPGPAAHPLPPRLLHGWARTSLAMGSAPGPVFAGCRRGFAALCLLPPLYGPRLAPPVIIAGSFTTSLGLQRVHLGIPGWASWEAISKVESVCHGLLRERRAAGWGKSGGDVGPRLAPAGPAERSRANEPFRVVTGGVEMLRPFYPSPAPRRGHVCVLPHEPSSRVRLLSPPMPWW